VCVFARLGFLFLCVWFFCFCLVLGILISLCMESKETLSDPPDNLLPSGLLGDIRKVSLASRVLNIDGKTQAKRVLKNPMKDGGDRKGNHAADKSTNQIRAEGNIPTGLTENLLPKVGDKLVTEGSSFIDPMPTVTKLNSTVPIAMQNAAALSHNKKIIDTLHAVTSKVDDAKGNNPGQSHDVMQDQTSFAEKLMGNKSGSKVNFRVLNL
jgi:hypothetical protein